MFRSALVTLVVMFAGCSAGPTGTASVTIDGQRVPRATSMLDLSVEIGEFRDGSAPADPVRLIATAKRYGVCIVAHGPVAVLDAVFPASAASAHFEVKAEDGRVFSRCLVRSLKGEGEGRDRRLTYCLRCENVTTPP
jgi:hypothetical protein